MDRWACIDIHELPLQLLLRRHPDWRREAVAVVAEDHPQGRIEWVNERARTLGVLPGQRYGEALAVAAGLRAGVVSPGQVAAAVATIIRRLRRFTPEVESSPEEPGLFWLGATGLTPLYPDLNGWEEAIRAALTQEGLAAAVVVGFTRFGTYAAAKGSGPGVHLLSSPAEERATMGKVSLARLGLPPEVRDRLAKLGVITVSGLLALPPAGLLKRYGPEVHRLHRLADDDLFTPLAPEPEKLPVAARTLLDFPETDGRRLLRHVERLLVPLLDRLAKRQQAVAVLHLHLFHEIGNARHHRLRPASPTRNLSLLLEFIRLRLESSELRSGVVEIALRLEEVEEEKEQLPLLAPHPHRDPAAAEAALARIQAELGEEAVVRFRLREAHLPEARFTCEPMHHLAPPCPLPPGDRRLVRRFFYRPHPLPAPSRSRSRKQWLVGGERVQRVTTPYILSGGWWRGGIHREYRYAATSRGHLLWLFYDHCRNRWFLQGRVE